MQSNTKKLGRLPSLFRTVEKGWRHSPTHGIINVFKAPEGVSFAAVFQPEADFHRDLPRTVLFHMNAMLNWRC